MTAPHVDIIVEAPAWNALRGVKPALRRAISAAAKPMQLTQSELAIVLTDDAAIRELNRRWRGSDKATNVLSFPAHGLVPPGSGPRPLGDVVIAYETMAREAQEQGLPFTHHLTHLAVHGFLHLLGYDHESDTEAETMEQLERDILARLDVPDPYATREEADRF
ncbi:MAG: rRNA maturation RNase YbeY [Xanthobacteraceae bacterium]|nr:rRNA maturation RNase YbeY [Xanthobacteraceae bacterium]MBV9629833.1 rRNA maturation RNase YbeY [Xanthobacteraceae bacterium]